MMDMNQPFSNRPVFRFKMETADGTLVPMVLDAALPRDVIPLVGVTVTVFTAPS